MAIKWMNKDVPAHQSQVQEAQVSAVVAHKPKMVAEVSEEMALVDELVELDAFMTANAIAQKVKRIDAIKKVLQSIAKDMPEGVEAVIAGSVGEAIFSPCKVMTTISDKSALRDALSEEVYFELSNVTLTDAKKYLSEIELEKLSTKSYGSRTLNTVKPY